MYVDTNLPSSVWLAFLASKPYIRNISCTRNQKWTKHVASKWNFKSCRFRKKMCCFESCIAWYLLVVWFAKLINTFTISSKSHTSSCFLSWQKRNRPRLGSSRIISSATTRHESLKPHKPHLRPISQTKS